MKLSVVIPNRNDTVMLGVTVRSILEELKAIDNDGEIVIVDNSDEDLWNIIRSVNISPIDLAYVEEGRIRLIHQSFPSLYSARQTAIEKAQGEYVYNVDSHTIIGHNSLLDLVNFMDRGSLIVGMAFAPIGWMSKHEAFSRHDIRTDQGTIFGSWGRKYKYPVKICWHFGSCIFNRDWFLNVHGGYDFFATKKMSWGGGEFYVAMKTWMLGYENWAVPCSPQFHIGPFSNEIERRAGYRYRLYDKTGHGKIGIGIFAAMYGLGGDEMKEEALKAEVAGVGRYGGISVEKDWEEAKLLAYDGWENLKKRQVTSFKSLMEHKPWVEEWGNWHPDDEIKRVFNLSSLEIIS